MSLQSCYVKDVDGNHWRNPVIRVDDWQILFDDDGFAELVMPHHKGESLDDAINRAVMLLINNGVPAHLAPGRHKSRRRIGNKFVYARSFNLYWTGPLPKHLVPISKTLPVKNPDRHMGTRF